MTHTRHILESHADFAPAVLHVIGSMDPRLGGASEGLRKLLPLLEQRGVSNEVLCLDDPSYGGDADGGILMHSLGRPGNPWRYNRNLMPWLQSHGTRFDVVIVHGLWLHHGLAVSKWVRGSRRSNPESAPRLMVMPHGMLDPWFQESPGRRWKAFRNRLYWWLAERSVIASADALLFTSGEELLRSRRAFPGYPDVRERVVGFGTVRPPKAVPARIEYPYSELPLAAGEPYLLYLGRIDEKKGVDLIVEAYSRLRSQRLPALLLAGPGWDSRYGRTVMQSVRRDADLSKRIHMDGMLSGDRKWQAIRGCQALLLPSHHENFGVTVAEALACGRPVLLSDKVNIHREVLNAGAGLCDSDTVDGVISLLSRWQSMTDGARSSMSAAALEAFESGFRMEGCAERILSVLRELLAAPVLSVETPLELCL